MSLRNSWKGNENGFGFDILIKQLISLKKFISTYILNWIEDGLGHVLFAHTSVANPIQFTVDKKRLAASRATNSNGATSNGKEEVNANGIVWPTERT